MYKALLKKRKDNKLNEYKENALLTDEIIKQIELQHDITIKEIHKNIYLTYNKKTIEFDVLIQAETYTEKTRWISIELKENDVTKVISQANARRDFVHYSYIVLNCSPKWIVSYLIYVYSDDVKRNKLGFFSKELPIINSKYITPKIEIDLEKDTS